MVLVTLLTILLGDVRFCSYNDGIIWFAPTLAYNNVKPIESNVEDEF
jgi:hypothetical protein